MWEGVCLWLKLFIELVKIEKWSDGEMGEVCQCKDMGIGGKRDAFSQP